ncbi:hypothetical protein CDD83_8626 [Cordyceps sp. RAO-2017]|nr:hypothetical protein CDD83_8626 [Cordyceps sp. RAO-2017]
MEGLGHAGLDRARLGEAASASLARHQARPTDRRAVRDSAQTAPCVGMQRQFGGRASRIAAALGSRRCAPGFCADAVRYCRSVHDAPEQSMMQSKPMR